MLFVLLCIKIFAIVDAFIGARRIGMMELKRFNRWYVYAGIYFASMGILFAFEKPVAAYSIPSGSMHPTVLTGDYVFVDKSAYTDRPVERGDVAVFWEPRRGEEEYLMRIVGLPGDRIQMIAGVLHINAKPVERERIEDFRTIDYYGNSNQVPQYVETLPNGREHRILEASGDSGQLDSTEETSVPEAHYFAMGDNRDNSRDSRMIGFVPAENLIGRAEILYFSLESDIVWWQVWRWPGGIRYARIGGKVS